MQTNDHVLNSAPANTYGATISRFMNWASERIAKEVEDNERIEKNGGKVDFLYHAGSGVTYTDEEKAAIIKTVDELREQGYTVVAATNRFRIHNTTYYTWKRELNK